MGYVIGKSFTFAASHRLSLPASHQCARLHGHNYTVWLELAGSDVDAHGMVYDFGALAPFRDYITEHIDHRHLNDVMHDEPTAEYVARHLFNVARDVLPTAVVNAVTVWETATCWACYRSA